jgi:aryl-alcohol dehydrogenase-like predicted oxidoreductase
VAAPQAGRHRTDHRRDQASHLDDAVAAVDVTLADEEIARLEEPYHPHPVRGHE